jgi:hypothetical protein
VRRIGVLNALAAEDAQGQARIEPAALNSPNETDRKTPGAPGLEPQGGTRWDGLSPRLSLPLRC